MSPDAWTDNQVTGAFGWLLHGFWQGHHLKKKKGHLQLEQYIYIVDGIQGKSIVNLRLGFKQLKLVAELKTVDV